MPITSEGIDKCQRVAALGWVNLVMDENIGEDFLMRVRPIAGYIVEVK